VDKPLVLSKRTELILKVVMILAGPLFLIGLLEGVAYVWERAQANGLYAWELVASRRIELIQYPEPGAGYTLMQPGSSYEWQQIPVTINSQGLRGPETSYDKPSNTIRILNLGDSVAMGWGVREEETYGRRLAQVLNEEPSASQNIEVINAGVPGWNPANELAYLQAEGLRYEPDLILLDLTIVNDIYGKSALLANQRPAIIEWLRANTHFWPFMTVQFRTIQARANGRERIDVIDPPTEPASYFPLEPAADRWDELWSSISAMQELAETNDARFVIILFPLEFQVLDEDYSILPQEVLAAKAAEAGIPVLDLLPAYRQACAEKPGGPCQLEDRYLFADVWMHPSAYGHMLTATEIATFLDNLQD
jgi:lysophospholipase L1-like esterase